MKNFKTILITGITGQDGAYLTKLLLKKGCSVVGLVRTNDDYSKLEHLGIKEEVVFKQCDLLDLCSVESCLMRYRPAQIYNFAAQSSVSLSKKQPAQTIQFNIMSVVNLLEAIRLVDKKIKFFQASSCEMFGNVDDLPASEKTLLNPLNPYAISKVSAHQIVGNYRESYGMFACSGVLFNHESYLRGRDFFVKKVIRQAVEIKKGMRDSLKVGNLEIKRDLGYAPDYVRAMYLMMQQEKADDFVISSGCSVLLRDVVYYVFDTLGINKNKVIVENNLYRTSDIPETRGDNSKAKKKLGWSHDKNFFNILDILIEEELQNQVFGCSKKTKSLET